MRRWLAQGRCCRAAVAEPWCAALSAAIVAVAATIRLAVEAAAVVAATAMAMAAARGSVHRASCGCFRNPSASATQFARRRDPPRLGKLQTLACNL